MMHRTYESHVARRAGAGTPKRPRRALAALGFAALAVTAAACGSSGGTPTPNAATTKSGVTTAYKEVFDLANKSLTPKIAAIQDGSSIKSSFNQALSSSLASSSGGASVSKVVLEPTSKCGTPTTAPAPCAQVTYAILSPTGSSLLGNEKGYASYVSGKWQVAKSTICTLLGLFYQAAGKTGTPAGCAGT